MQEETKKLIDNINRSLKPGSHPGLSRVCKFCELCGHPEQKIKTIHVAGTNGKGSVSNMTRLILTEAGYKTAVFNSPFLSTPLEYFQIDGVQICEERFIELCSMLLMLALQMSEPPTEFEFYTVAALVYFAEEQCDFAVIEAGMGGRLDATNVLTNTVLCMITNIGIDHKEYLGDTIEQIALEKAGIMKPQVPVVVYPSDEKAVKVLENIAQELQSPFVSVSLARLTDIRQGKVQNSGITEGSLENEETPVCQTRKMQYTTDNGQKYEVSLPTEAEFQMRNCALVLEGVEVLKKQGICIDVGTVNEALMKFCLPARFEILSEEPLMIADGGHNPQCIDAVMESMQPVVSKIREQNGKVIVLSGIMRDKDYAYVYRRLTEIADEFVLVAADVSRALTTDELEAELLQYNKTVYKATTPMQGAEYVYNRLNKQDCLLVSGSFYIMSDILSVLKRKNNDQIIK